MINLISTLEKNVILFIFISHSQGIIIHNTTNDLNIQSGQFSAIFILNWSVTHSCAIYYTQFQNTELNSIILLSIIKNGTWNHTSTWCSPLSSLALSLSRQTREGKGARAIMAAKALRVCMDRPKSNILPPN